MAKRTSEGPWDETVAEILGMRDAKTCKIFFSAIYLNDENGK